MAKGYAFATWCRRSRAARGIEIEIGRATLFYIPLVDADLSLFVSSHHHTRSNQKGAASYRYSDASGTLIENALWAYPDVLENVAPIRDSAGSDLAHAKIAIID